MEIPKFKKKPEVLIMCSSRRRADRIQEMLTSIDETNSEGTELVIYVWEEDPQIEKYRIVLKGRNVIYGPKRNLVEVINYLSTEAYPDIKYYAEINDDMVCRTKDWDKILVKIIEEQGQGWGVACGRDLIQEDWYKYKHPSGSIISGNIIRTLGYYDYPLLRHYFCDVFQKELSLGINRLFHNPNVVIEHKCWVQARKSEVDENIKEAYTRENRDYGIAMFFVWKREQKDKDIKKLKDAMRKEGIKIK